ncbi:dockerin type 1 [Pelomyxa schiedti]|nr:dockerin type 1 [Pelomyxa schiedti]
MAFAPPKKKPSTLADTTANRVATKLVNPRPQRGPATDGWKIGARAHRAPAVNRPSSLTVPKVTQRPATAPVSRNTTKPGIQQPSAPVKKLPSTKLPVPGLVRKPTVAQNTKQHTVSRPRSTSPTPKMLLCEKPSNQVGILFPKQPASPSVNSTKHTVTATKPRSGTPVNNTAPTTLKPQLHTPVKTTPTTPAPSLSRNSILPKKTLSKDPTTAPSDRKKTGSDLHVPPSKGTNVIKKPAERKASLPSSKTPTPVRNVNPLKSPGKTPPAKKPTDISKQRTIEDIQSSKKLFLEWARNHVAQLAQQHNAKYKPEDLACPAPPYIFGGPNFRNWPGPNLESISESLATLIFVRYLCWIDPPHISLDPEWMRAAHFGAVLLCESEFDHHPKKPSTMSEEQYVVGHEGTSTGNIGCGYRDMVQACVCGFLDDSDAHNIKQLGHRRWLLSPHLSTVGFGYYKSCSNTKVFGGRPVYCPSAPHQSDYLVVAFPPPGYYPITHWEPHYAWSFTLNPLYFETQHPEVVIKRTIGKSTVDVPISFRGFSTIGYGIPLCVIVKPTDLDLHDQDTYTVTIQGITTRKPPVLASPFHFASDGSISYTTTFFHPQTQRISAIKKRLRDLYTLLSREINSQRFHPVQIAAKPQSERLQRTYQDKTNN